MSVYLPSEEVFQTKICQNPTLTKSLEFDLVKLSNKAKAKQAYEYSNDIYSGLAEARQLIGYSDLRALVLPQEFKLTPGNIESAFNLWQEALRKFISMANQFISELSNTPVPELFEQQVDIKKQLSKLSAL